MACYRRSALALGAGVIVGTAFALYFLYVVYLGRQAGSFLSTAYAEDISGREWFLALLLLPLTVALLSALLALVLGASLRVGIVSSIIVYFPFVVLVFYFFTISLLPVAVYAFPAIVVTWSAVLYRLYLAGGSQGTFRQIIKLMWVTLAVMAVCVFPLSYPLHEQYFAATVVIAAVLSWSVLPTTAAFLLPPRPREGQR